MPIYDVRMANGRALTIRAASSSDAQDYALETYPGVPVREVVAVPDLTEQTVETDTGDETGEDDE